MIIAQNGIASIIRERGKYKVKQGKKTVFETNCIDSAYDTYYKIQ